MVSAKKISIGLLSQAAEVKVTTIRYYESIGLMAAPARTASGQRIYDQDALERLRFIRHSRELGFPVPAIRELIELQLRPGTDCAVVDGIARRQLADVRNRLQQLQALAQELEQMVVACAGGEIAHCTVMATLNDHAQCAEPVHGYGAERSIPQ